MVDGGADRGDAGGLAVSENVRFVHSTFLHRWVPPGQGVGRESGPSTYRRPGAGGGQFGERLRLPAAPLTMDILACMFGAAAC